MPYIPFDSNPGNAVVVGRTRSGKTYGTIKSLDGLKAGVFFFNVQLSDVPGSWLDADAADDIDMIKRALESGEKINYMPNTNRRTADVEFAYIVDQLYDGQERGIYVVADECHLYKKKAEDALVRLATTCLRFRMKSVFISQRPAEMNYTCMTQSTLFAVYNVSNFEWPYFQQKKFPVEAMQEKLGQGGEYAYVLLDTAKNEALSGPFKV